MFKSVTGCFAGIVKLQLTDGFLQAQSLEDVPSRCDGHQIDILAHTRPTMPSINVVKIVVGIVVGRYYSHSPHNALPCIHLVKNVSR